MSTMEFGADQPVERSWTRPVLGSGMFRRSAGVLFPDRHVAHMILLSCVAQKANCSRWSGTYAAATMSAATKTSPVEKTAG
jgi:hypothetical protein